MSYATVQAAVSTVIKKVAGYDGTNVKEEDYRAIAIGKLKFVVLSRGDSDREYISMGNPVTVINTWTVIATLFVPWTTARDTVASSINTEMQSIMDELDKWPQLDGTAGVIDSAVDRLGDPESYAIDRGRWWAQDIAVVVKEIDEVTLSE